MSTSGTKGDIIDRLERQRNKSVKKKPKKLTDEEYFRQKEILEQELEIERLNQVKRDHERKLKFLKLESLRHGDDNEKSDESPEESSDEDEDTAKGAVAKKPQGKKSQQPLDKNASILELLSLPKPSLMEFDGDPMQYHMFKNSFDAVIDSANISDSAKLNRLFELCKGTAREVILPCALGDPSDGYAEARELLKERFGDSYVISEAFIDKLTSGGPIKQHEVSALRKFADEIRSCVRTLSAMDMLGEIDTRIRMVKLTERLPYAMQGRWRTKAIRTRREKGAYPDINEFLEFVEDCVEEASDPVFGVKQRESSKRDSFQPQVTRKTKSTALQSSATQDSTVSEQSRRKQVPCPQCQGSHPLFMCYKFKALKPPDRLKLAKEKEVCINCLKPGHTVNDCRNPRVCKTGECNQKHSFFVTRSFTDYARKENSPSRRSNDE